MLDIGRYFNNKANEDIVHLSLIKVNMQNIPSHATDIRHMFRATPEQEEFIDVKVSLRLHSVDEVFTRDGVKKCKDVIEGDTLECADNKFCLVESIQPSDEGFLILNLKEC